MSDRRGIFIALEGVDGSGKATQLNLLAERLQAVGYGVAVFDFPRYSESSSHFVRKYLNGDYGPASEVNPYTASLFYALDRYEAAKSVRQALSEGKIVLSNRYAGSNMAHQGSKFTSEAEQRGFFIWADSLEFQLLGIPRPDINIFLRVPVEISYKLIGRKARRNYTDKSRDEHEADINHLQTSLAAYDLLCRLFTRDFIAVDCTQNGQLMSVPAINDRIWQIVKPLLPSDLPRHSPASKTVRLSEPARATAPLITTVIQQPARDEKNFSFSLKKTSRLVMREILKHSYLVSVEPSSGRQKGFGYLTPDKLSGNLLKQYEQFMVDLGTKRAEISAAISRPSATVKPAAIKTAVSSLSPMAEQLAMNCSGSEASLGRLTAELRTAGLTELIAVADCWAAQRPNLLPGPVRRGADKAQGRGSTDADRLPPTHSSPESVAKLDSSWPRLEFDLLAGLLFADSELGKAEILDSIAEWNYEQKISALGAALRKPSARTAMLLTELKYDWELLIDGPTLDYLLSVNALRLGGAQMATPRYGYETPKVIESTGLDDMYSECFEASLELFSNLQAAGYEKEAQYVVLHGHRQRWLASTNYHQLVLIHGSSKDPESPAGLSDLRQTMFEALRLNHPTIADSIISREPSIPSASTVSSGRQRPKSAASRKRSRAVPSRRRSKSK